VQTSERSYRCHYTPVDLARFPVPSESGVLPFIQIKAADAEQAQRAAHALTGCPIAEVQRLDPVEFTPPTFAQLKDVRRKTRTMSSMLLSVRIWCQKENESAAALSFVGC
jgi:hypothetical protein